MLRVAVTEDAPSSLRVQLELPLSAVPLRVLIWLPSEPVADELAQADRESGAVEPAGAGCPCEVGPGGYDIHSPRVPSLAEAAAHCAARRRSGCRPARLRRVGSRACPK